ncbi:chromosome segregation protein SMC [Pelagibaculum spongiae]|uniref:Chromosome segregation protein SMC n=2 Tax=Pelagibaculum spongiae TaxID=2080658 RepID=A0A2V1GY46_9GAMM|nr:chromosome segregation protein SMC [Pelagibaculum spongiae]
MQLREIKVSNFKSLVDFKLSLHGFNCLIGLNGSGKSTVLQFLDFLAQQVKGNLDKWLEERDWKASEINCQLGIPEKYKDGTMKISRKKVIEFSATFSLHDGTQLTWQASFNPNDLKCTFEKISMGDGERLLIVKGLTYAVLGGTYQPIRFNYQGSILSQLLDKELSGELQKLKDFLLGFRSLELLAPQSLRQKTKSSEGGLGLGGQRLSAFIHEMSSEKKKKLSDKLKGAYPKLKSIDTKALRSGGKELNIAENFAGQKLPTEARHMNDGMLRVMAILAQLMTEHSFMAFDEVENGINPELIEYLIDTLVTAEQQVLVTTHSPMILNFMEDEVAMNSVQYLYKTREGYTCSIPFFSIPSLKEKLTVMGPGEVFIDTDLGQLGNEIASLKQE